MAVTGVSVAVRSVMLLSTGANHYDSLLVLKNVLEGRGCGVWNAADQNKGGGAKLIE